MFDNSPEQHIYQKRKVFRHLKNFVFHNFANEPCQVNDFDGFARELTYMQNLKKLIPGCKDELKELKTVAYLLKYNKIDVTSGSRKGSRQFKDAAAKADQTQSHFGKILFNLCTNFKKRDKELFIKDCLLSTVLLCFILFLLKEDLSSVNQDVKTGKKNKTSVDKSAFH